MSNRIFIGESAGHAAARVAAPGANAQTPSGRMILDSDFPSLKLYAYNKTTNTGGWDYDMNTYIFDPLTLITFPSLPFIPLVDIHVGPGGANDQISYPPGIPFTEYGSNPYVDFEFAVYNDRVVQTDRGSDEWIANCSFAVVTFRVLVYRNPVSIEV